MEAVSGESTAESFIAVERAEGAEDVEDVFAAFYAAAHAKAARSQRPMPWGGEAGWQKVGNALPYHLPLPLFNELQALATVPDVTCQM